MDMDAMVARVQNERTRTCLGCDGTGCDEGLMHPLMLSADDQTCRRPCPACLGSGTVTEPEDTSTLDEEQALLVYNEWAEANPFDAFVRQVLADCFEAR
jgi:hypothetical protein